MSSKLIRQNIEDGVNSRPSAIKFEMAYQARAAIDRSGSRSSTRNRSVPCTDQTREAVLQLLDALERLEQLTVDTKSDPEPPRRRPPRKQSAPKRSLIEIMARHCAALQSQRTEG